jgi:hypothetical protein
MEKLSKEVLVLAMQSMPLDVIADCLIENNVDFQSWLVKRVAEEKVKMRQSILDQAENVKAEIAKEKSILEK